MCAGMRAGMFSRHVLGIAVVPFATSLEVGSVPWTSSAGADALSKSDIAGGREEMLREDGAGGFVDFAAPDAAACLLFSDAVACLRRRPECSLGTRVRVLPTGM